MKKLKYIRWIDHPEIFIVQDSIDAKVKSILKKHYAKEMPTFYKTKKELWEKCSINHRERSLCETESEYKNTMRMLKNCRKEKKNRIKKVEVCIKVLK